jgi:hypothetical protein
MVDMQSYHDDSLFRRLLLLDGDMFLTAQEDLKK